MNLQQQLLQHFNATQVQEIETVQTLWSGYGSIVRYALSDKQAKPCSPATVIVKAIQAPETIHHPRGWHSKHSHQRKLQSYKVESHWYQQWASRCRNKSRVAHCYGVFQQAVSSDTSTTYILLEDLDAIGFSDRANNLELKQAQACLDWLAYFHGQFLCDNKANQISPDWPQGLWEIGSYWHLSTRHEEYAAMVDCPLKKHAHDIDDQLNNCRFKSLVHGDAKVANFCFNPLNHQVAAVDFQYVGGGCGMKDVAYFLGSCLTEADCNHNYQRLIDGYFITLAKAIKLQTPSNGINPIEVETEWRALLPFAWADFQRFIVGWSPQHSKNNKFSQKMAENAIMTIKQAKVSP